MSYACYAVAAPGLEPLVAAELTACGLVPTDVGDGGVAFDAHAAGLYTANLWLRIASRVVIRLGRFHAEAFHALERHAGRLPFQRFIGPNTQVRLRATCRKSRLYHSDAVAERVGRAIALRTGATVHAATVDDAGDGALVLVRLFRDECTVSLDTSGALLHRRGYRLETAKAPLRETLAAAVLAAGGYDARSPLVDPFCGSGTIPIEAAMLARRLAPGRDRPFAFMRWPEFDPAVWASLLAAARAGERPAADAPILGADRDAGATAAAAANAERAGVASDIEFRTQALSALEPPPGVGWLVTNPPYGVRVGDQQALRNLYAQFGNVVRTRLAGWRVVLLASEADALLRQTRLPFDRRLRTINGGIPVSVRAILL